jgi:hypothetical protein
MLDTERTKEQTNDTSGESAIANSSTATRVDAEVSNANISVCDSSNNNHCVLTEVNGAECQRMQVENSDNTEHSDDATDFSATLPNNNGSVKVADRGAATESRNNTTSQNSDSSEDGTLTEWSIGNINCNDNDTRIPDLICEYSHPSFMNDDDDERNDELFSTPLQMAVPSSSSVITITESTTSTTGKVQRKRCGVCQKKLYMNYFNCSCSAMLIFCTQHRYPYAHQCAVSRQAVQQAKLTRQNPLVIAKKFERI